ncbi:MAG: tetratricopeptide repeat protein [Fimbriimonadaceae bacterium]|nr:tetratricopeptide repeat protein [Fimbriimonadaceae bacterium]
MQRVMLGLGLLFCLGRLTAAPAPPQVVQVGVADFAVTGLGEPRYWLGYVYSEVLARRLILLPDVVVVMPLTLRPLAGSVALQSTALVEQHCQSLTESAGCQYVLGGLIEDKGEKLAVTCCIASKQPARVWSVTQEVPLEQLFAPQAELIGKRFLPNLGLRLKPEALDAFAKYEPGGSLEALNLVGRGWRAYDPGTPEDAFKLWRQALAAEPSCRLAGEALAETGYLYRRRLLQQALDFYRGQVAAEPQNAVAAFHLAEIYMDLGQYRAAESMYVQTVALRNTYLDAYVGLSAARLELGFLDTSILAANSALMLAPNDLRALHNRAVARYRSGLVPEAKKDWERILQLDPTNALAKERLERYATVGVEPVGRLP